jgi:hypothetical protein
MMDLTPRERALVRYALAYLATGDGRRARGAISFKLGSGVTRGLREIADEWRGPIWRHVRDLSK